MVGAVRDHQPRRAAVRHEADLRQADATVDVESLVGLVDAVEQDRQQR
jgi:hypothetical protein